MGLLCYLISLEIFNSILERQGLKRKMASYYSDSENSDSKISNSNNSKSSNHSLINLEKEMERLNIADCGELNNYKIIKDRCMWCFSNCIFL